MRWRGIRGEFMRPRQWSACVLAAAAWLVIASACRGEVPNLTLREVPGGWGDMCIDVRGVAAGGFDPAIWQHNTLNLVPDTARSMIEVRPGKHRNIYAPSVVEIQGGWRVYFAGWDGNDSPNDQVYCVETRDNFVSF